MTRIAPRLVHPAKVVLAVAVGLALLRLLAVRARRLPALPRTAPPQSVAGEEDPGAALEDMHPRLRGAAPTLL